MHAAVGVVLGTWLGGVGGCGASSRPPDDEDDGILEGDGDADVDGDSDGDGDGESGDHGHDGECESIVGAEGIAVARPGTIYYSQPGGVGRQEYGGCPDDRWLLIDGADAVSGLAVREDGILFVGSPTAAAIFRVATPSDAPVAEVELADAGSPAGLAIGLDGALYYTDDQANTVSRVVDGQVTHFDEISDEVPRGLVFTTDDSGIPFPIVVSGSGTIAMLRFETTHPPSLVTAHRTLATATGDLWGVGLDQLGRLYVTDRATDRLVRFAPVPMEGWGELSGEEELLEVAGPGYLAFGKDPGQDGDLYAASSVALAVFHGDSTGAP